jgi:O-antigen/teichoic acid export membrane protein
MSLYATRLLLAALGVEDFGLYNLVGGVIGMLGFLNASMAGATQRFISFAQGAGDINKVKRIFNMSTLLHLGIALVVVLVFEIAGYFFFNSILNIAIDRVATAKLVYQFMVISTLFTVISVPYEAVITSHENMLFFAILGIVESILKLAIALYISYGTLNLPVSISISEAQLHVNYSTFDNLIVYGLLMAALSILMLLFRRIYCHRKYPECEINFKKYYDKSLLKQISNFAAWSFLGTASSMLANYGTNILINIFFGTLLNAAQAIANQVSGQLGAFATTLMRALNPMIDKSEGAGNRALMLKATMMGCKVSYFLLMVMYIPFLIETSIVLVYWLKIVPDFAVLFSQLLLISFLIQQLFVPLATAISAEGNIKAYQISTSILAFLPLPVTYIFFKLHYPAYTLYIIYSLFNIIGYGFTLYYAKKNCQLPLDIFLKNVIGRCTCTFILVFLISLIPHFLIKDDLIRLIMVTLVDLITFLIIVFFIGFSNDERVKITQLVSLIFGKIRYKKFTL